MDIYSIIKGWYEFKAENKDINSNHTELIFYIIDLNNRLAWKEVFGLPSIETSQFLGMNYRTFLKTFEDLIELNLIKLVKKSKNQYIANQISIEPLCIKLTEQSKSTYKAFIKAQQKQLHDNNNIDIQLYNKTILHNNNLIKENEILKIEIEKLKNRNEKPKKTEYNNFKEDLIMYGFSENLVNEWIQIRKNKKLTFTETVIKKFTTEIEKVLQKYPTVTKDYILEKIIYKGWGGFDAQWIENERAKANQNNNNQNTGHKNEGSNMKYALEWLNNGY